MLTAEEERVARIKVRKNLMWLGIISIAMMFAGLTSAYVVAMGKPGFVVLEMPMMFWISAIIIAISSFSMLYAVHSAKKGAFPGVNFGLILTLFLGLGFVFTQFRGWQELISQEVFFSNHATGQYLYMLSGVHLIHLGAGLISLIFTLVRSINKAYFPSQTIGLEVTAMYWHFLGILWVYLLLFLHFVR
ncbi:MAG: heme-copper oxidase subunit III [Bacteroidia bacterium]|nr:heme-copper oxidase subunit III [Bacteroidia bacterium]